MGEGEVRVVDMHVRAKSPADQAWIEALLTERWRSTEVVFGDATLAADRLPAWIAGKREGLATYHLAQRAELVTLDAVVPGRGVGTALVQALADHLRAAGWSALHVSTTNDNLDALRFYQRRGFCITAIHPGAIDQARRLKPVIAEIGRYGIPIRDEIELVLQLK